WKWRTRRGAPPRCPPTGAKASPRLMRSGSPSGRESERGMSDIPSRISLREVGPRDGLQNEDPVPTPAKIALIDRLGDTGVSRIEAVSFVRPDAIPQMADADEVWAGVARASPVRYSALAPNLRGARRALDAGFTEVEVVVSASDTHNRKNVNRSTEQSLDEIAVVIDEAHQRGATCQVIVSTAWGCPYEGDVPVDRVLRVAGRAVADGADSGSFGDTTGMATPRRERDTSCGGAAPRRAPGHAADPGFPHPPRHRPGQRAGGAGAGGGRLRRVGGRAGRLPVRARGHRQHRHRGTRAHGRGQGGGHGRGPARHDRRGGRGGTHRRPGTAVPGAP